MSYRFSIGKMRAVGFVVQAEQVDDVWPGFADVFLHVHPQPGEGLSFYYFPDPITSPTQRLPQWALDAIEQGVLHACFVGGPGEIPLTDLRVEVRRGRWDPLRSGERAFFVAAYMAMRKAIHLSCVDGPRILEFMCRVTMRTLAVVATPLIHKLQMLGASGLCTRDLPTTHEMQIVAVLPERSVAEVREHCERLNRIGCSGEVTVERLGFRGHGGSMARVLVRTLGLPPDWPTGEEEVPRLGGAFPTLPIASEASAS